jgi:hypothetical protein
VVDINYGATECIKSTHPMANETSEEVIPYESPKENQRTYFEQTLTPRVVDLYGYKYNNL